MLSRVLTLPSRRDRLRITRRLLGLPAEQPSPRTIRLHTPTRTIQRVQPSAEMVEAWHAEDWRADFARFVVDAPRIAKRQLEAVKDAIADVRCDREVATARVLVYQSPYVHTVGDCLAVDGYLQLPSGRTYGLQVVAVGARYREYVQDSWDRGAVLQSDQNLLNSDHSLYVPVETLDEEVIAVAIERWYRDRFAYVRRHWGALENAQPVIDIELHWQTVEEDRASWFPPGSED
jgi:hypothetical protein